MDDLCRPGMSSCRMVETVVGKLGGLHIAVNNAGIIRNSPAEDHSEEDWDLTFAINTKGVFFSCQVLLERSMAPTVTHSMLLICHIAGRS